MKIKHQICYYKLHRGNRRNPQHQLTRVRETVVHAQEVTE